MKHSTKKSTNVRKDKSTDAEIAALILYNSDCLRLKVQPNAAPACRHITVSAAMGRMKNPFALVHAARRIARHMHDERADIMAVSINRAFCFIAQQSQRKPVLAAMVARAA